MSSGPRRPIVSADHFVSGEELVDGLADEVTLGASSHFLEPLDRGVVSVADPGPHRRRGALGACPILGRPAWHSTLPDSAAEPYSRTMDKRPSAAVSAPVLTWPPL